MKKFIKDLKLNNSKPFFKISRHIQENVNERQHSKCKTDYVNNHVSPAFKSNKFKLVDCSC